MINKNRLVYIDLLRLLCIVFVVLDHSIHAYGSLRGISWWVIDGNRSIIWDFFYLFENTFMVAILFLLSGIFVPSSLEKYGIKKFIIRKIKQLVVPYFVGIFFILPIAFYPLSGTKYREANSFYDFFENIYLGLKFNSTDFLGLKIKTIEFTGCITYMQYWFLMQLFLILMIFAVLFHFLPNLFLWLQKSFLSYTKKPICMYRAFVIFSTILLIVPDLYFGGHIQWLGYGKFFLFPPYYLLLAPFFVLIGMIMGAKKDGDFYKGLDIVGLKLQEHIKFIIVSAVIFLIIYTIFSFCFYDDSYHKTLYFKVKFRGYKWFDVMPLIKEHGIYIFIRCFLRGVCAATSTCALFAVFYKYKNRDVSKIKMMLANTSFSIYIWHSIPVIWLQVWFLKFALPGFFKGFFVALISLLSSWLIVFALRFILTIAKKILNNKTSSRKKT